MVFDMQSETAAAFETQMRQKKFFGVALDRLWQANSPLA
jgi:hypothetical protein